MRRRASSLGLNRGPRIAVIYAAGTINSGKSGYDPVNGAVLGSETLIEYIRQARNDWLSAEADLKREAAVSAALARIGQELISSLNLPTLLEHLCRTTVEVLHCDFSHTWLWRTSEDALPRANRRRDTDRRHPSGGTGDVPITEGDGFGPTGQAKTRMRGAVLINR